MRPEGLQTARPGRPLGPCGSHTAPHGADSSCAGCRLAREGVGALSTTRDDFLPEPPFKTAGVC